MAEKTLQERLRNFGKLELAISGKPWTLGEDAAAELDRLGAQLREAREREAVLESALQLIGNELSLHADQGPAGVVFRSLLNPTFAATEPKP